MWNFIFIMMLQQHKVLMFGPTGAKMDPKRGVSSITKNRYFADEVIMPEKLKIN